MTEKELNSVRDLNKQIRKLENHLQTLRINADNIVPVLDGLPHSSTTKSRVEKLALMILEDERKLSALRGELIQAKSILAEIIMGEVDAPLLQTLLLLRYVSCCSFKETARRMKCSLRHMYRLHEKFLRCHLVALSES